MIDPRETEVYKLLEAAHVVEFEEGRGIVVAGAYYTPDPILKAIRDVMGEIDVDPSSCKCAQRRIQALKFYDWETSGLENDWIGRVYLNPNYNDSEHLCQFIKKAAWERGSGNMAECILHVYTTETWQPWFHAALRLFGLFCFLKNNIIWILAAGE